MKLSVNQLSKHFHVEQPVTSAEIARMESHFGYTFPADYKEFLQITNGLEGAMDDDYLVLWGTGELIELNEAYKVKDFIQGIILIGSNGAEDAYAFDITGSLPVVVKLPFIGMGYIANEKIADTFEAFLLPRVQPKGFIKRLLG